MNAFKKLKTPSLQLSIREKFIKLKDIAAIPAGNDAKSLTTKDRNEKSLRNEILQPIDSKRKKPPAGIAEDIAMPGLKSASAESPFMKS